MIKIGTSIIFLLIFNLSSYCQKILTNLYGFEIGQFRQCTINQLGKVFMADKYEDGFEYEVFLLKPDTSLYIIFEYAPYSNQVIHSIQFSGEAGETLIGTKKVKLGMDKSEVEKIFGKPSEVKDIGKYGEQWVYQDHNYSLEITSKGKLSSIKIKDSYSGVSPDVSLIPTFTDLLKALNTKNNSQTFGILAPDLEIYYEGQALSFQKSLLNEINTDESKIFGTIKTLRAGLENIDVKDTNAYEESMRLAIDNTPMHVIKIKKDHLIKEIVLKFWNGKYVIWEIKT